jgi:hypothetical protein
MNKEKNYCKNCENLVYGFCAIYKAKVSGHTFLECSYFVSIGNKVRDYDIERESRKKIEYAISLKRKKHTSPKSNLSLTKSDIQRKSKVPVKFDLLDVQPNPLEIKSNKKTQVTNVNNNTRRVGKKITIDLELTQQISRRNCKSSLIDGAKNIFTLHKMFKALKINTQAIFTFEQVEENRLGFETDKKWQFSIPEPIVLYDKVSLESMAAYLVRRGPGTCT